MDRKDFLLKAGFGIAGLTGLSVLLEDCKKNNGPIDFTIDLNDPIYGALKNVNGYTYKGDVIIARASNGDYIALTKICTHQGCTVSYFTGDVFQCPCHGARFDNNGNVTAGPAPGALHKYSTELKGNMLRVFG